MVFSISIFCSKSCVYTINSWGTWFLLCSVTTGPLGNLHVCLQPPSEQHFSPIFYSGLADCCSWTQKLIVTEYSKGAEANHLSKTRKDVHVFVRFCFCKCVANTQRVYRSSETCHVSCIIGSFYLNCHVSSDRKLLFSMSSMNRK